MQFTSSPAHSALKVNGKLTWFAVFGGGLIQRLSSSSELKPPITVLRICDLCFLFDPVCPTLH